MVLYWILRFVSLMNVKKRSRETETYGQGETAKDLTKKTANDQIVVCQGITESSLETCTHLIH